MTEQTNLVLYRNLLEKFMGLSSEEADSLMTAIQTPTPKEHVFNRPIRGGGSANYVPGYLFIQKFNEAFGPLWSYEVPEVFREGDQIVAKGKLSVQVPGRTITRIYPDGLQETIRLDGFTICKEQFGSTQVKRWTKDTPVKDKKGNQVRNAKGEPLFTARAGEVMDLGNDYKSVATEAMKKCGSEFGFFSDVYKAQERNEVTGPSANQLAAFYKRASDIGKDKEAAELWAQERTGKPLSELAKNDLLSLVADLIEMGKQKGSK